MRKLSIFHVGAVLLVATGCAVASNDPGSLGGALACEPGEVFECACASGQPGTQTCDEAGAALSACECGSSSGTGGSFAVIGTGGAPPVTGTGGAPPVSGTGGAPPVSGTGGEAPVGGVGGTPPEVGGAGGTVVGGAGGTVVGGAGGTVVGGAGGTVVGGAGGTPPVIPPGTCCADGDCLCHGPDPTGLTSNAGPFNTASFTISTGIVHYPTDAEPPFAAVAICGGFLNTGPEMAAWAPFYASHGIVTVITTTTGADLPDLRATKLLAAIDELKDENTTASSPLFGNLAGRYGTSGYSMGGGGTTIASTRDATLRTSVGLAAWAPVGAGVTVPTLLLCGSSDTVAPCSQSQSSYTGIPGSTSKMMVTIAGSTHFSWFGPKDAGMGTSGATALAFQKVFLEGDERWRPFLLQSGGTVQTNIQ